MCFFTNFLILSWFYALLCYWFLWSCYFYIKLLHEWSIYSMTKAADITKMGYLHHQLVIYELALVIKTHCYCWHSCWTLAADTAHSQAREMQGAQSSLPPLTSPSWHLLAPCKGQGGLVRDCNRPWRASNLGFKGFKGSQRK